MDLQKILTSAEKLRPESKVYHAPLKEGKYTAKIVGIGINEEPTKELKAIGFYKKEQIPGRNNNYDRIDLITSEGKRTLKNVFKENEDNVTTNIRTQLNIEDSLTYPQTLAYALATGAELEIWVNYNESYKNVDFYDAQSAREAKKAEEQEIIEALNKL